MFFAYLKDKKSWLFFFLLSLLAADLLLLLDPGIVVKISSLVYLNVLILIAFSIFVFWRCRKETVYMRRLVKLVGEADSDWHEALPESEFARDEMVNELLKDAGMAFSKRLSEVRSRTVVQGEYTAAWVHEVKAPLTAMKLLIDANQDISVMRRIDAEWLRVFLLVDQQLYISRLPTLEQDYVLESVPLKSMVTAEVRELMSWCREKNIALELDGLDRIVVTDLKWSRFVFRQVLTNAVKYSPLDGTITVKARVKNTGQTILSVKDEGPGIPDHEMPRIFDKGFTGGAGRIQNAATGLGLYLAKTVAEKMGIALSAFSEENQGTKVEMAFPLENEFERIRK